MKLKELITKVQKRADTHPKMSHVTASDVSRVISLLTEEIAALKTEDAFKLTAAIVTNGVKVRAKARAKGKK